MIDESANRPDSSRNPRRTALAWKPIAAHHTDLLTTFDHRPGRDHAEGGDADHEAETHEAEHEPIDHERRGDRVVHDALLRSRPSTHSRGRLIRDGRRNAARST